MSRADCPGNSVVEHCVNCGQRQPHRVSVGFVTEGVEAGDVADSLESYRIIECRACGTTIETGLDDEAAEFGR